MDNVRNPSNSVSNKEFPTYLNVNFTNQLTEFWAKFHYNFTSYFIDMELGYSPEENTLLRRGNKKRMEKITH
jgi:hypothetical protein